MPCAHGKTQFHCNKCGRTITSKKRSKLSATRSHYWRKHRTTMMKGR